MSFPKCMDYYLSSNHEELNTMAKDDAKEGTFGMTPTPTLVKKGFTPSTSLLTVAQDGKVPTPPQAAKAEKKPPS